MAIRPGGDESSRHAMNVIGHIVELLRWHASSNFERAQASAQRRNGGLNGDETPEAR